MTESMVVTFKNRSSSTLYNCSSTYLIDIEDTNIMTRSFVLHATNKSDCNNIETLCSYGNPYFSNMVFLRDAKYVVDNSSGRSNSIEINITGNRSIYNGRGVLNNYEPEIDAGRDINDRKYRLSFLWLGSSWGTEIDEGKYRVDL